MLTNYLYITLMIIAFVIYRI